MLSGFKGKVKMLLWSARERVRIYRGASDYRRWSNATSLSVLDWESRTAQMAKLIPPGTTVLEFGAGRMILKNHLAEGCKYIPSDLVDRGSGTIVCDLNARDLPVFPPHDVVFFSGVLEFVYDLNRLAAHISQDCNIIVASYSCVAEEQAANKRARRAAGWVNDYTSGEFERLFARSGFRCDHVECWNTQKIYRFVREENALA
jgi:hypothetical protein